MKKSQFSDFSWLFTPKSQPEQEVLNFLSNGVKFWIGCHYVLRSSSIFLVDIFGNYQTFNNWKDENEVTVKTFNACSIGDLGLWETVDRKQEKPFVCAYKPGIVKPTPAPPG